MHLCKTAPSQKSTLFRDRILFYYLLAISFIFLSHLPSNGVFSCSSHSIHHIRVHVYVIIITYSFAFFPCRLCYLHLYYGWMVLVSVMCWCFIASNECLAAVAVTSSKVSNARTHIISHFSTLWRVHATARMYSRFIPISECWCRVSCAFRIPIAPMLRFFGTPKMRLSSSNNTIKLVYIIYNNMYMHIFSPSLW